MVTSSRDDIIDIPEDLLYRMLSVVNAVAQLGQEANVQAEAVHIWADLMKLGEDE